MLTKEQYQKNLSVAKNAFTKAGFDTSYTLGQAVNYFLRKTGFSKAHGRMFFHEAMHVAANALSGNGTAEAKALTYEVVLCRGKLGKHNTADNELFATPEPVPSDVCKQTTFFSHFCNAAYPAKKKVSSDKVNFSSYPANENLFPAKETVSSDSVADASKLAHSQALERDEFFQKLTGGRALYQLTTKEARELPAVFLGIVPNKGTLRMSFPAMTTETRNYIVSLLAPTKNHLSPHLSEFEDPYNFSMKPGF